MLLKNIYFDLKFALWYVHLHLPLFDMPLLALYESTCFQSKSYSKEPLSVSGTECKFNTKSNFSND